VAAVAKVCHSHGDILCVVDAITALGVIDLGMDRDGLDVLISGSQKAMMLPPGLAFIALSERAWEHSRRAQLPRFYLDLARELTAARSNQTAWTASVSLVAALHVALQMMQAEGLQQIFKRHRLLADGCRAGLQALGCSLYSQAPAHGLTAALPPAGIDASEVVKDLQRRFNLTLVGGQDAAKGKIFRVAHMGYFDELDILTFLGALELSFAAQRPQGASASAGASAVGSTAAQAVFVAAV
jgi:aspartate aminotransferase-like enzyme